AMPARRGSTNVARLQRPDPIGERPTRQAHAERPRKHLGKERQDRRPEGHGASASGFSSSSASKSSGTTTTLPPAISTVGTYASLKGTRKVWPRGGATSRRSPAP